MDMLIMLGMLLFILLLSQTILPIIWPLKFVYFWSFRQREQEAHLKFIAEVEDYKKRREIFFKNVAELGERPPELHINDFKAPKSLQNPVEKESP